MWFFYMLFAGIGWIILIAVVGTILAVTAAFLFTIYSIIWFYRGVGWTMSKINRRVYIN